MRAILVLDPNGSYPSITPDDVKQEFGILLTWLSAGTDNGESAEQALTSRYPYFMGWMTGGIVDVTGTYRYPDDPPLEPVILAETEHDHCYMYPYGFVSFVDKKTGIAKTTRMD